MFGVDGQILQKTRVIWVQPYQLTLAMNLGDRDATPGMPSANEGLQGSPTKDVAYFFCDHCLLGDRPHEMYVLLFV